ncbi:tRNA lysidine(34) synthetase TilS [Chitinophaga sp. GCM10012297]|uniref:tRNA(Ile)-lysidine synthase n=1 Tax=Chitinophaga chungangae TaxID=2821488 RepID=A0ABS3YHX8_9BACT|nr:tRNA lysidine(34) synthetase TilS [Chitinophaga chungangae]MBO9154303.1 tRNA lysidine(34) synthetase TilS [Chitinophaga chungangae]
MIGRLREFIREERIFNEGEGLLLAVSGGLDSSVLCHLLVKAGWKVELAHCNFMLRGAESDRDEAFVRSLGERYQAPVHVTRFDTAAYAEQHKLSVQVAARDLRYAWLERQRAALGLAAVVTAHHMQDNVETLWMNLSKGTGMAGLHGILPLQGHIARPLLFATREEIAAYAKEEGVAFVEDSSNITDKYTRNYFRHNILPPLQALFPDVVRQTGASIDRFREAEELYKQAVEEHKKKLLVKKGEEYFIPLVRFSQAKPLATIAYELLKPFGCSPAQASQVTALLDAEPGRYVTTASHRIVRDRKWFIVAPLNTAEAGYFIIEKEQENLRLPNVAFRFQYAQNDTNAVSANAAVACIDAAGLQFPLMLRRWKQGDYFYPLGMNRKKKLSRFFIDQKLSLPQKEKVWVLESADKRIVWVAGMRIDNRFRVTEKTRQVLRITMTEERS